MSFFNFLFDIFLNSIYLIYVSQFGLEDLDYDFLFTSQREPHSVPDMDLFYYFFTFFVPIRVITDKFTKINSKFSHGKL